MTQNTGEAVKKRHAELTAQAQELGTVY